MTTYFPREEEMNSFGTPGRTRTDSAYWPQILSLLRLPIPPQGHIKVEAAAGIEPTYSDLQSGT